MKPTAEQLKEKMEAYWKYEREVYKPFWDAVHGGVRKVLEAEGHKPSWTRPEHAHRYVNGGK